MKENGKKTNDAFVKGGGNCAVRFSFDNLVTLNGQTAPATRSLQVPLTRKEEWFVLYCKGEFA